MNEHNNDVINKEKTFVVASHCDLRHNFDFKNVGILDEEPNYHKRRLS